MTTKALLVAAGVFSVAAFAVAAPLLTYSLSLAIFGLPHVLTELRYVDERFGARISPRLGYTFLAILLLIVGLRLFSMADLGLVEAPRIELILVLGLAAVTLPILKNSPRSLTVGLMVLVAISCGLLVSPISTLVLLAVAHNLTPIGFLVEQCGAKRRRAVLAVCGLVFGLIPILIATGLPWQALNWVGWTSANASILGVGTLSDQLGVFVPPMWRESNLAVHLFAAAAYLQCVHYAVVIHVLPRLSDGATTTAIPWPRARVFTGVVFGAGLVFFLGFAQSFTETRSVYGIFAAVHAWIEVPILLLALELRPRDHATSFGDSQHAA
ncbi:MAG: hypothetical protein ACI97A_003853 [Planctomycetota bacterium]|jgi:hypothetical protein